jgi:hypothetical protein
MMEHDAMGTNERLDVLISRVVDAEATGAEWDELSIHAERDPSIWRRLAESQRDQTALREGVCAAIACAGTIEAPVQHVMAERLSQRTRIVATWGGWAAAAVVLLGISLAPKLGLGTRQSGIQATLPGPMTIVPAAETDPDAALAAYLKAGQAKGTVMGESPNRVLIDSRPAVGGGYDVVYLRQIIERTHVPELFQKGTDDLGRPAPVRYEVAPESVKGAY